MSEAGFLRVLISCSNIIEHIYNGHRGACIFMYQYPQAILQVKFLELDHAYEVTGSRGAGKIIYKMLAVSSVILTSSSDLFTIT